MKRRAAAVLAAGLVLAGALYLWWRGAPPPPPPLLSLLPRGTAVSSQGRVELDGRAPFEIAATVYLPPFPGGAAELPRAVIAGFDRWRHRWRLLLMSEVEGIPAALEAGPLLGRREAVLFPAYAGGRMRYRVFGLRWGRPALLYAGETGGPVEVVRGVIAERDPQAPRGLRWTGRTFVAAPAPPPVPPSRIWYYWTDKNGFAHADATTVFLVPGQRLLAVRNGGGPAVAPIPDSNLDAVGGAFRPRRPGTYTLTIPDFAGRPGAAFRLRIEVEDGEP